jgi:hypothetical protein
LRHIFCAPLLLSPAQGRAWSDTSDFISTRDSFSSLDEDGTYNGSAHGQGGHGGHHHHGVGGPRGRAVGSGRTARAMAARKGRAGAVDTTTTGWVECVSCLARGA